MSDPTRYPDGSTDQTSRNLDVIADALAAPADSRQRVAMVRREGKLLRTVRVRQVGTSWGLEDPLARGEVAYLLQDDGSLVEPPVVFTAESAGPGGGTGTGPAQPMDCADG